MHEWPLVIFTLFMQASVGCLAITMLCYFRVFSSVSDANSLKWVRLPLLSSFVFGGIGLLGSLFHLGNPFHMFYTLFHVSSSWMSREVLFTAIYMGLMFLSVALLLLKNKVASGLLILTLIVGIADIYVMSAIYAHTLFTLWGGLVTYAGFYGTALLLGGSIAATFLVISLKYAKEEVLISRVVRISLASAVGGILLMLLSALSLLNNLDSPIYMGMTERTLPDGLFSLSIIRVAFIAVGMLIAGRLLCKKQSQSANAGMVMALATVCLVVGESVGRYVFFSLGG